MARLTREQIRAYAQSMAFGQTPHMSVGNLSQADRQRIREMVDKIRSEEIQSFTEGDVSKYARAMLWQENPSRQLYSLLSANRARVARRYEQVQSLTTWRSQQTRTASERKDF